LFALRFCFSFIVAAAKHVLSELFQPLRKCRHAVNARRLGVQGWGGEYDAGNADGNC
jgi:hypothetical protein